MSRLISATLIQHQNPLLQKLALEFTNKSTHINISLAWLRDHDPKTFHTTSQQRTRVEKLSLHVHQPKHVQVHSHDGSLHISWKDGTTSIYSSEYLNQYLPYNKNHVTSYRNEMYPMKPWANLSSLPTFKTTSNQSEILKALCETGVILFKETPSSVELTEEIVRNVFGPPRETFYGGRGGMWDTHLNKKRMSMIPHIQNLHLIHIPTLLIYLILLVYKYLIV
jgi:hypothetical protein